MQYMRLIRADDAPDTGPLIFTASRPGKQRDGLDLASLPWRVDNYRANPIVTWAHDFAGNRLPVGRADVDIIDAKGGQGIRAAITFDTADPFAAEIDRKYRDGFLHTVSVSWDDVDDSGIPTRSGGGKPTGHDLLEIAAVPVPGDPGALIERARTILAALTDATITTDDVFPVAVTVTGGTTANDVTPPASAVAAAGNDSTDDDEPAQGRAWVDVAAEMVAVFAPDCPDNDRARRRRYNTLTARYRTLGRTPPEYLTAAEVDALGPDEWRGLWLEDELSGSRVGAVLNARNTELLVGARDALDTVIKSAQATGKDEGRAASTSGAGRRELDPELVAALDAIAATLDKIAAAVAPDDEADAEAEDADAMPEGEMVAEGGDGRSGDGNDDDNFMAALVAELDQLAASGGASKE
jgi:hypothetical protein